MSNETIAMADESYNRTVRYEYDNKSLVTHVDWDNFDVRYEYDEFDRVSRVYDSSYTWASYEYSPSDQIKKIQYYNGVETVLSYEDLRGLPERINTSADGDPILDLSYTYDEAGRVTYINDETYQYDALGRLRNASGAWGAFNYTYDAVGNRLSEKHGSAWTNYSYCTFNRLHWANSSTHVYYEFDDTGRMIHKNDGDYWTYTYDSSERMVEVQKNNVSQSQFAYDAFGRRIRVVEDGSAVDYVYAGDQPVEESGDMLYASYVYGNGQIIVKFRSGRLKWAYHEDLLGSVRVTTDSTGWPVFQSGYEPFGEPYGASGSSRFTYTGQVQDSSSGLFYLRARYYDPDIGRFASMDPLPGSISSPQTLNGYSYCGNDPINNIDPTGKRGGHQITWQEYFHSIGLPYARKRSGPISFSNSEEYRPIMGRAGLTISYCEELFEEGIYYQTFENGNGFDAIYERGPNYNALSWVMTPLSLIPVVNIIPGAYYLWRGVETGDPVMAIVGATMIASSAFMIFAPSTWFSGLETLGAMRAGYGALGNVGQWIEKVAESTPNWIIMSYFQDPALWNGIFWSPIVQYPLKSAIDQVAGWLWANRPQWPVPWRP